MEKGRSCDRPFPFLPVREPDYSRLPRNCSRNMNMLMKFM